MSVEFTEEWYQDYLARHGTGSSAKAPDKPKRPKYGNTKVESNGIRFDSKHESAVYEELRLRGLSGEFAGLARQVTFYLPGGIKYIADFVTLGTDGRFTVYDAKSEATRKDKVYRLKKQQMRQCLGIEIKEV